ncbi:amidohydrolase family protein [Streptomyces sp. DK15]|uniref:amidohydrolase family protein n=1 Tax=Streptomyces sp. DK15 TaxID=2957499 RepID=UPI0029A10C9B|nr:amidohydrolase family protein [Streptomyces sp. DK15]MDX2391277.1 amidohydrolase family protein [Streptomyces sp. DK15]
MDPLSECPGTTAPVPEAAQAVQHAPAVRHAQAAQHAQAVPPTRVVRPAESLPTATATAPPSPGRRRVLAGLGMAAATPLVLGAGRTAPRGNPAVAGGPTGRATVLRNAALVLTMDPALGEGPLGAVEGADLLMRGGAVAAVGRRLAVPAGTRVIDASDRLLLPGFVDVHTHLWQSSMRGGCAGRDLFGWLAECNRPTFSRIPAADMYRFVRLAALDSVQSGVTTLVDWVDALPYDTTEQYVRALAESGVRFTYAMFQAEAQAGLLSRVKKELIDPLPLASAQVATHAARALEGLNRVHWEIAQELGVMLNSHVLERAEQRADDPVGVLTRMGAFGPRLLMNHAIHLTDDEVAAVAAHDVRAAHCPLSNMRLASGIMRLPDLGRRAVKVGLGQDGGTNDSSDFFALMKSAIGLQRARSLDASVFPQVQDVLRAATLGGAEAIGMADRVGSLTPGKRADVLVLDPGTLNFAPRFDRIGQIVFNGRPENVEAVFVDGRPLKLDGRLVDVDTERVVREAEAAAARLRATGSADPRR